MSSKKKTPTTSPKPFPTPKGNLKPRRLGIRVLDDDATPETPAILLDVLPDETPRVATDESNSPMPWDAPTSPNEEETIELVETPTGSGVLAKIGDDWLEHLKTTGTSASTLASYAADFGNAKKHFGSMDAPQLWTEHDITGYENAMSVTHTRSGKPKAMPTVLKTRRVLRLALTWAFETRRISSIPYATKGHIPLERFEK